MKKRVWFGLLAWTSSAYALPTIKGDSTALSKLSADASHIVSLQGVKLYQDHENPRVIYVGPANRKVETGNFSPEADADRCEALKADYGTTYRTLPGDPKDWKEEDLRKPVSPFSDLNIGNYIRLNTAVDVLVQAKVRQIEYRTTHAEQYQAYKRAKEAFDAASSAVAEVQRRIDGLTQAVQSSILMLGASQTPEARASATDAYQASCKERDQKLPLLQNELTQALAARESVRGAYDAADRAWAPYASEALDLDKEVDELQKVFAKIDEISRQAFIAQEDRLRVEEDRNVGVAVVTYSLYGNETELVRALPSAEGLIINPLPVYDVTLGARAEKNFTTRPITAATSPDQAAKLGFTTVDIGRPAFGFDSAPKRMPIFTMTSPFALFETIAKPKEGAQTIYSHISRGAYCMGSRKPQAVWFKASGGVAFNGFSYLERRDPVFADSVGLHYKFVAKAEPASVKCTLDFKNTDDIKKTLGKVTGFFYSRAWTDQERKLVEDGGIRCHIENSNSNVSDQDLRDLSQKYSQELAAEFIMAYGKSWSVAKGDDVTAPSIERDRALARAGSSMLAFCGPNPYCFAAGLTLKTVDEIFSTSRGSATRSENLTIHLERDYSIASYREESGDAAIDLKVTL